jgi:hypothetical protein
MKVERKKLNKCERKRKKIKYEEKFGREERRVPIFWGRCIDFYLSLETEGVTSASHCSPGIQRDERERRDGEVRVPLLGSQVDPQLL